MKMLRQIQHYQFLLLSLGYMSVVFYTVFILQEMYEAKQDSFAIAKLNFARKSSNVSDAGATFSVTQLCIAVITGFSDVPRKGLVVRLLRQIDEQLEKLSVKSLIEFHVFCQGACKEELSRDLEKRQSDARRNQSKLTMLFHEILLPMKAFHKLGNEGKVKRDYDGRHIVISWNYRKAFEFLFVKPGGTTNACRYALVFEDDLILAADALQYLIAGSRLMSQDASIFSVSLFGDNSYPPYAQRPDFFRRVSHFAGLGFVMSRAKYQQLLRRAWKPYAFWDVTVQRIMIKLRLSSVTPEVSRVLHIEDDRVTKANNEIIVAKDIFDSMTLNDVILPDYDAALSTVHQRQYNALLKEYIHNGTIIEQLHDVCFVNYTQSNSFKFVYFRCSNSDDLHLLLTSLQLIGRGLDTVVRGEYDGTLFIRICRHSVLIACHHSHLVAEYLHLGVRTARPTFKKTAKKSLTNKRLLLESKLDLRNSEQRKTLATFQFFTRHYTSHVIADDNISCDASCRLRGKTCDLSGTWFLASGCDFIKMIHFCSSCSLAAVKPLRFPVTVESSNASNVCVLGNPHFSSCLSRASDYNITANLVCACRL